MTLKEKIKKYDELIDRMKQCDGNCSKLRKITKYGFCPECKISEECRAWELDEINLWSYWQGGREHLDADILLVGQDWGDFYDGFTHLKTLKKHINRDKKCRYEGGLYFKREDGANIKLFPTDKNLASLFEQLGYDDILNKDYPELFFTNYILCYRENGYTGSFKDKWIVNCQEFFHELVDIIEPKIILCLGKKAYEGAVNSLHGTMYQTFAPEYDFQNDNWFEFLDNTHAKPITTKGTPLIVPLSHCGGIGTRNRNMEKQISDWQNISKYLQKEKS